WPPLLVPTPVSWHKGLCIKASGKMGDLLALQKTQEPIVEGRLKRIPDLYFNTRTGTHFTEQLVGCLEGTEHILAFVAQDVCYVNTNVQALILSQVLDCVEVEAVKRNGINVGLVRNADVRQCFSLHVVIKTGFESVVLPRIGKAGIDNVGRLT